MELQDGIELILGSNPNEEPFRLVTNQAVNDEPVALSSAFLDMADEFLAPSNIVTEEEMLALDPEYQRVDPDRIPRKLNEEEIGRLFQDLANIDCIDKETSVMVTDQYREMFARLLLDAGTEMIVSEPVFAQFATMANLEMAKALSTYGEKYGSLGSFALSCAETQVTLKFKKTTGAGKTSILKNGIEYIKGIFHARKRPAHSYCGLHFVRKMSRRELIDFSYQLKHITVGDLLNAREYSIGRLVEGDVEPGITHQFHANERTHYPKVYCIRLHFDKDKLFAHRLTPYAISMLLQENKIIGEGTRIIPSPFEEGYIDVVSQTALNMPDEGPNEYVSELKFITYPKIKNYQLQGIAGIKEASVERTGYHSFFRSRLEQPTLKERTEYEGQEEYVVLHYDLMTMANSMQPNPAFIEDSLAKAGVTIQHRFRTKHAGRVYGYAVDARAFDRSVKKEEFQRRFSTYIEEIKLIKGKFVIRASDAFELALTKDAFAFTYTDSRYVVDVPRITSIGDAFAYIDEIDSHYCYITTEGSFVGAGGSTTKVKPNILRALSVFPEIDFSRFTTNSLPYMAKFFGIEVCRNYEIYAIAENQRAKDSKSQPRFTVLLADHTTFFGEPLGTDFYQNARKRDNDFAIIADNSHAKQILDTYANRGGGSYALNTTTSASVLMEGRIRAGENIAPTLTRTKEAVLKSLRKTNQAKRVTNADLNDVLRKRVEGVIGEIGEQERYVEIESMTIKPPLLSGTVPVVYEPMLGLVPPPPERAELEGKNTHSPYSDNFEFEIPSTLSPLAPLTLSLRPIQVGDVIALIQRVPTSPFTIDLNSFSVLPKKKRIPYAVRLPTATPVVDEEEIRFDPLDFLRIVPVRFVAATEEMSFEELKSYF